MTKKPRTAKDAAGKVVKNINGKTRPTSLTEARVRAVSAGLRGEESISELCHRESFNVWLQPPSSDGIQANHALKFNPGHSGRADDCKET